MNSYFSICVFCLLVFHINLFRGLVVSCLLSFWRLGGSDPEAMKSAFDLGQTVSFKPPGVFPNGGKQLKHTRKNSKTCKKTKNKNEHIGVLSCFVVFHCVFLLFFEH